METLEIEDTLPNIFPRSQLILGVPTLATTRRLTIQAPLLVEEPVKLGKEKEKRTKIIHAVKGGTYRVTFTFNGLPYQPREIRLFLEKAERRMELLREGIMASQDGIHFTTIVLDRQALQNLYVLLLKHGARVKIERTNHFSSRKLGRMVWRAVHAPS